MILLLTVTAASVLCDKETILTRDISTLSETEKTLRTKLESHIAAIDDQLKGLDYLLNHVYKGYNFTEEDAHEYVSNPINTYMLIKRTSMEWGAVKKVLFNDTAEAEFNEIVSLLQEAEGGKEKKEEL